MVYEGGRQSGEHRDPRAKRGDGNIHRGSQAPLPIMTMLITTTMSGPPGETSLCSGDPLTSQSSAHPHLYALVSITIQISSGFKAVFLSPLHKSERQLQH